MGARGRKSSAELTLVQRATEVLTVSRPGPPPGLAEDAATEWRAVVSSMSADYFVRPMFAVLEAYCRHAAAARQIDQLLAKIDEDDNATVSMYDRLLKMHERESRALSSLAVRLGLAYATREFKSFGGKKSDSGTKPWDKLAR